MSYNVMSVLCCTCQFQNGLNIFQLILFYHRFSGSKVKNEVIMPVFEIRTLFYIEMYIKLLYLYAIRALTSNAIRSDYQLSAWSATKDISFDWSHHSVSSAYSKVRTTALHKIPSFTLAMKGSTKIRLLRVLSHLRFVKKALTGKPIHCCLRLNRSFHFKLYL